MVNKNSKKGIDRTIKHMIVSIKDPTYDMDGYANMEAKTAIAAALDLKDT
jgi:hypothetical protein